MNGLRRCPRCGTPCRGSFYALSRVDNATHICSQCGQDEALWQFAYPKVPLPPVNEPLRKGQI